MGVVHPEKPWHYILAVECDGARYHSAVSARERGRLRQEILEGQGWHFHRIWSTDWFYRRSAEIVRLRNALKQARIQSDKASCFIEASSSLSAETVIKAGAGDPPATSFLSLTEAS